MLDHDIHERLIARLEELRKANTFSDLSTIVSPIQACLIDMAIDNVRRKCPTCGDTGWTGDLPGPEECPLKCNREALLAEWDKALGGKG